MINKKDNIKDFVNIFCVFILPILIMSFYASPFLDNINSIKITDGGYNPINFSDEVDNMDYKEVAEQVFVFKNDAKQF